MEGVLERPDVRCPNCRTKIQRQDGDCLYLRNAIIKVDLLTHASYAKCPQCKTWVEIPLRYTD